MSWAIICASQIGFRRKYVREGGDVSKLAYRTPGYPVVPILGVVLNLAIAVSLLFIPGQRVAIYAGVPIILLVLLGYYFIYKPRMAKA
ncbi:hypothetical protein BW896_29135 [Bacillus cereus]|nr:hypothetical protein BW896_29135 [Bacillus cereus]